MLSLPISLSLHQTLRGARFILSLYISYIYLITSVFGCLPVSFHLLPPLGFILSHLLCPFSFSPPPSFLGFPYAYGWSIRLLFVCLCSYFPVSFSPAYPDSGPVTHPFLSISFFVILLISLLLLVPCSSVFILAWVAKRCCCHSLEFAHILRAIQSQRKPGLCAVVDDGW